MNFRELMLEQKRLVTDTSALFSISEPRSPKERAATLIDLEGLPVGWLEARVETSKGLKLPAGLKIIKLEKNPKNDKQRRCVFWWKGTYHEEYFDYKLIRNVHFNTLTEDAAVVFKNDTEHLLHRLEKGQCKQTEFNDLIKKIELFSKQDLSFNDILLKKIEIENNLKFNPLKIGENIKRLTDSIFNVYDPWDKIENKKYSETVLVVPITYTWIKRNPVIEKFFKESSLFKNEDLWLGGSGNIVPKANIETFKSALIRFKDYLSILQIDNLDYELDWLNSLTKEKLANIKRIVIIHDEPIEKPGIMFQQFIALENSFSIFRLSNILSIIIHELTQYTSIPFLGDDKYFESTEGNSGDGHILPDDVASTWKNLQNKTTQIDKLGHGFIDILYVARKMYLAIGINLIIQSIKK